MSLLPEAFARSVLDGMSTQEKRPKSSNGTIPDICNELHQKVQVCSRILQKLNSLVDLDLPISNTLLIDADTLN